MSKRKFEFLFWFDTETTGLDPMVNDVHQLGCIIEKIEFGSNKRGTIIFQKDYKMRPLDPSNINAKALETCKKTAEELLQYPDAVGVLKQMKNDIWELKKKYNIFKMTCAGQNVQFDIDFLKGTLTKCPVFDFQDFFYHFPSLCVKNFAASTYFKDAITGNALKEVPNFKLDSLTKLANFDPAVLFPAPEGQTTFHDAVFDCTVTREVYYRLLGLQA